MKLNKLFALFVVLTTIFSCKIPEKEHIKKVHIQNMANMAKTTSQTKIFVQKPKKNKNENCHTSESYEFVEEVRKGNLVLHSQVKLTDNYYNLDDLLLFRDLVLEAWVRKFTITEEQILTFIEETNSAHIIYAKTFDSFKELTNFERDKNVVACIIPQQFCCFESPTNKNLYTIVLSPAAYYISRKGTLMSKELEPPATFVIHEYVHWISSLINNNIDKNHKNKKLWIKDDPKSSVQAIAYNLFVKLKTENLLCRYKSPKPSLVVDQVVCPKSFDPHDHNQHH